MSEMPKNLPQPIVYGPDFPQFKMLMRHGRQTFESRKNQNLFLTKDDFDERGTFTMAAFVRKFGSWRDALPLIFTNAWLDDDGRFMDWELFTDEPRWEDSSAISTLLGYCDTEPQRQFFLQFCKAQYSTGLGDAWDERHAAMRHESEQRGARLMMEAELLGGWENVIEHFLLDELLDFPALIPEVWLNYVGYDKTEQDEAHLSKNPQRVDFVMVGAGRKCVIEIDGPSHYADYIDGSYVVSQVRYAKNLAIERSLRRQGWEIHRFANIEVEQAVASGSAEFCDLASDLPGFCGHWYARPRASAESLSRRLGGVDDYLAPS